MIIFQGTISNFNMWRDKWRIDITGDIRATGLELLDSTNQSFRLVFEEEKLSRSK